ncbi:flavin-containing monooxygenase [Methylobacterium dankookense]|uniref:Baeyer-Villiger monooxygenase n=1 Tax=Methylobacterium dankookense TaxID=560405 RepID=A0A564FXC2_9HYPH|nr:NAD(P)/FAD-dependent oxidoreductase [Methylobacterium dankookense]GJD56397.1 Baeyer-Villiger monooxygenase [Methylobacterium dankookense]VUF12514.1 Baeyer-Villiger monooxygenase [Methylobacterium dankookense]
MSGEPALPREVLGLLVVGAGFSGIAMAIRARAAGIGPLLVIEKAEAVGGTWRENTYPGAACDVPSHLYSLSFAPKADWTRSYARQPEIAAYMRDVVAREGLGPYLHLSTAFLGAAWDEAEGLWRVETSRGMLRARAIASGMGFLHHPGFPPIPGRESFAGTQFHSATWDHGCDLKAKRIGVIGTGASAIQFVPQIAPLASHLTLFQRSPPWIVPRGDRPVAAWRRALYRHLPAARRLERARLFWLNEVRALAGFTRVSTLTGLAEKLARHHLFKSVPDRALRTKLRPNYRLGCKRVLISDDYYPTLQRANVAVETVPIRAITPTGVVMEDGTGHALDVLIFATGFDVAASLPRAAIVGRDGLSLAEAWADGAGAHQGISVAGFPNLFLLLGPNTALGHNSMLLMLEAQVQHVLDCLAALGAAGARAIEVRPEAQARFLDGIRARLDTSIWQQGGCTSWYLDADGRNSVNWPGSVLAYLRSARRARPEDYSLR